MSSPVRPIFRIWIHDDDHHVGPMFVGLPSLFLEGGNTETVASLRTVQLADADWLW